MKEARAAATPTIIYTPKILRTMAEICEAFGVGKSTVRLWVKQGAPICVEGKDKKKRYSAEIAALHGWRLSNIK